MTIVNIRENTWFVLLYNNFKAILLVSTGCKMTLKENGNIFFYQIIDKKL